MKLGHLVGHASGTSLWACHFLLLRFDEKRGFKPNQGESWIFQKEGSTTHFLYGGLGWYTGLWRSPAGKVYAPSIAGFVDVNPDPRPRAAPWRADQLGATLGGVWGLDDETVFTWGHRGQNTVLFRYDGAKWSEIESPGDIVGMHGIEEKGIHAVGARGLIARWDGRKWKKQPSPTKSVLSSVFVASDEEMYAVGNGVVLQGSVHGWALVTDIPTHAFGVAKWKGEVWVGASEKGLMKLAGSRLVPAKPNVKAINLDARGDLLITTHDFVAGTSDGKDYKAVNIEILAPMVAKNPPAWM
jgi:hypothetical protein